MAHLQRQQDRVALVAGATHSLGRSIAQRLAAEGARVGIHGRMQDQRIRNIVGLVDGFGVPVDTRDATAIRSAIVDIEQTEGSIEVLICDATHISPTPMTEHDADDWWAVVHASLTTTFHTIQAVLPGMRRMGGGNIVVVTSEWSTADQPFATAYAAANAGLISLTKTLGRELAPDGIVVNAVLTGVVDSGDADAGIGELHRRDVSEIPAGRFGRPDEIAAAVALLARKNLGAFVGQTIQINGGTTRCRV